MDGSDEQMFTRRPAEGDRRFSIKLTRIRGGGSIPLILCAGDLLGRWSHWDGHRTRACYGRECDDCVRCSNRQYLMWTPALLLPSLERTFVQVPASAANSYDRFLEQHGSAYGWHAAAGRVGDPKYGTVSFRFIKPSPPDWECPAFPSTMDYVYNMWGIRPKQYLAPHDVRQGDIEDFQRQLSPDTPAAGLNDVILEVVNRGKRKG